MTKNLYIISAVVAAIIVGAFLFFSRPANVSAPVPPLPAPNNVERPPVSEQPSLVSKPPPPSPTQELTTDEAKKFQAGNVIVYSDSGFSPKILTVKVGTTVIFSNQSSNPFWPASDPHPIHNGYPTQGGCIGSTFDACKGIVSGDSWWSFRFDKVGSWGYHDHLNPGQKGTVVVQ